MAAEELVLDDGVLQQKNVCEFQGMRAVRQCGGISVLSWRAADGPQPALDESPRRVSRLVIGPFFGPHHVPADGPQPAQGSPRAPSLTCTEHGPGCRMGL
jgi:hypothetical protein